MANGNGPDKVLLSNPEFQFFDDDGNPLSGGKVFIYEAGTTTKAESWTDASGLTPNTNPIILDAEGRCRIWVPPLDPVDVDPLPPGPPGPQGPPGPPGPPGATGNASEFSVTTDITSSQIYDWYGNYIEIAPLEDGTILLPNKVVLGYKYQIGPYATNSANFVLSWGPPIIPATVPNSTTVATILEGVADTTQVVFNLSQITTADLIANFDCLGKNLTLTLDAAVDGAPLIGIDVFDGGTGYAVDDTGTIDGGDSGATYIVTSEDGGVVTGVLLTAGGIGYTSGSGVATSTGGGQPGAGTGLALVTTSALVFGSALRCTCFFMKFVPI